MADVVTNVGLANITAAWHAYASRARYFQWGTGVGQSAASTDLADKTGTSEARSAGTTSPESTSTTGDTYRAVGTITALGSVAITELGVFDQAGTGSPPSGGNLCIYGDFAAINLAAGDQITFTASVQLS